MKRAILAICCCAALEAAGAGPLERLTDERLTAAQRADACLELRGDRAPETAAAMRRMLANSRLRTCAAGHLREGGAVDLLRGALGDENPEVRAAAAGALAAMQNPELAATLAGAARDPDLLVAAAAIEGLPGPHLVELARAGGIPAILAMGRAAALREPGIVPVARERLSSADVGAQLIALKVLSEMGTAADLPALEKLAATGETAAAARGRGFGLLPAVDVARGARGAIAAIEERGARR